MSTQPAAPPSAWDHASVLVGGVLAVILGAGDLYLRQLLTAPVDVAMMLAGFAALGVKGFSGAIPR